jgi:hypothetical protein
VVLLTLERAAVLHNHDCGRVVGEDRGDQCVGESDRTRSRLARAPRWEGDAGRRRRTTLEDADRRFREIVSTLPENDREFLLQALTADPATPAYIIGNLHASGRAPETRELLIDAVADPALTGLLVRLLFEVGISRADL